MRPEFLAAALCCLGAATAQAGGHEPAAGITAAIEASLGGKVAKVMPNGGNMMPACKARLAVEWLPSTDRSFRTAAVSCPSPTWTVYAGVHLVRREVALVATRPIPAGGGIDASDTRPKTIDAGALQGTTLKPRALRAGPHARQRIAAGQTITEAMTDLRASVRNGQNVSLFVNASGLTVSAPGIALGSGAIGDSVEVENAGSHRKLSAVIVGSLPSRAGVYLVVPRGAAD